ncbi:MAG: quinolinate synthase NadA [Bacteroidaceae bacterium]|nr:quinolinate synthase NadA [Bacteroidaceae bacterium]
MMKTEQNIAKWTEKGYADEPIPEGTDLRTEIRRMAREKNAVIMAHYYVDGEIQDLADFVGDSLALAQQAARTSADIIVMCGVHFMGETNKILCPEKKVLVPDLNATCSLAESCEAGAFEAFVKAHPNHTVISYVNTTAATKAVTDVVVTSGNARQIVESFPKDEKIIFAPDQNLGGYINSITGRSMLLWNGACHVHEKFSLEKILALKAEHPEAKILVHPECKGPVVRVADKVGSTAALLKFAIQDDAREFIVATESGILHEMQKRCPEKTFIPAPPNDSTCACNECNYMKLITLEKLYNCLKYEWPTVEVDPAVAERAVRPINRMLEISAQLGL